MIRTTRIFTLAGLAIAASIAQADVIVNTFGASGSGYVASVGWNIDSSQWLGKSFSTAVEYNFSQIDIAFRMDGENDQFLVSLRADSSGQPAATLESFVVTNGFGSGVAGVYNLNSATNPLMGVGSYHVTIEPLNGATGKWNLNNGGGQGLMVVSNDSGANWTSFTDTNGAVRVHGAQVVPEPMSIAAVGLGLAALIRRKRRS